MNCSAILEVAWNVLNSPAVIAAMAAGVVWLLSRLYAAHPAWQEFEGTIIAAVKWAEKTIPDLPAGQAGLPAGQAGDATNTATARLDAALKYVLKVYQETQGKPADAKTAASMQEGIQIVHAQLESDGNLSAANVTP